MSYNQNLFTKRKNGSDKAHTQLRKSTIDLYKLAMNLVIEQSSFDLKCPQGAASLIVAKHYMKKGQLEKAEVLLSRLKAATN